MKDWKKYIKIEAEPEDLFACLTNSFTIELWSGLPASIKAEPETEFEILDGSISGRIISVTENQELVQEWYFGDQESPSIVTFKIFKEGSSCTLEVRHSNIPDDDYNDIVSGWQESFLVPIKTFLELE